ncbi:hypothetical protein QQ045_033088 [Rhodiola kirilowii]
MKFRSVHDDCAGVRLTWAAEVRFEVGFHWFEFGIGDDFTTLDDDSRRLATFLAAVGGHGVEFVVVRFADHEGAILEEDWGVAEDEVDCAGDDAVAVVLTLGVGVECVLVAVHSAVFEDGEVGLDSEGYCLVLLWSCTVLKPYVSCHEKNLLAQLRTSFKVAGYGTPYTCALPWGLDFDAATTSKLCILWLKCVTGRYQLDVFRKCITEILFSKCVFVLNYAPYDWRVRNSSSVLHFCTREDSATEVQFCTFVQRQTV